LKTNFQTEIYYCT